MHGEQQHQQRAEEEGRHGDAQHREHHRRLVHHRVLPQRRHHAAGDAHQQRQHQRIGGQRQRDRQALQHRLQHVLPQQQRVAHMAVQQVDIPVDQLRHQRLVQPEIGADLRHLLRRRAEPGDDDRRVAGDEMQQGEGDEADQQERRNGPCQPGYSDSQQRMARLTLFVPPLSLPATRSRSAGCGMARSPSRSSAPPAPWSGCRTGRHSRAPAPASAAWRMHPAAPPG